MTVVAGRFAFTTTMAAPATEISPQFIQGMADRMSTSYYKYGAVADAYPSKVDAIASLKVRLDRYERTGNLEYLMDVANFAQIEYMRPRHPDAHFKAEDSSSSPGRKWHGEVDSHQLPNDVSKHK
jgi:hypothetical protein